MERWFNAVRQLTDGDVTSPDGKLAARCRHSFKGYLIDL